MYNNKNMIGISVTRVVPMSSELYLYIVRFQDVRLAENIFSGAV